jgi:NADPH:quinone reductase-like Zn-dependent oxidoreductase
MTGLPYFVRLMPGFYKMRAGVLGSDVAGVVQAIGAKVTGFRPGDEVMGEAQGSFAELAIARPGKLAPKPARLSFEQAAAVPVSGVTALQALRDVAKLRAGQRVLVIGAAGGVGTFAVQIAKAFEAEVTGVCSTSKLDLLRSIGADEVIDYTREDFTDGTRSWDVIVDTAGVVRSGRSAARSPRAERSPSWAAKAAATGPAASSAKSFGRRSCPNSPARGCVR